MDEPATTVHDRVTPGDVLIVAVREQQRDGVSGDAGRGGAVGADLVARDVVAGGSPMSAKIARMVVHAFQKPAPRDVVPPACADLTAKEKAVMQLLQEGFLYKEIGERTGISSHTVHFHIRQTYEKLHVRSRSQAVAKYTKK